MSTLQTTPAFDTEALRRGIEERDAAALRALYADDAEVTLVDRRDQPSRPLELRGAAAITAYLDEISGRDMEHRLERVVVDASGEHAAYLEACRYPDSTRVLCASVLDLRDGRIVRQTGIQAWDE
ncbi:nuclear transport factor 2 family protein [Streptacidiphilus rugosus]|uniref:nuclear transport factor 2 family protein n=1 Tax=Streptacidiphilus rugosus TaxID=405783 RepID=UPI00055EF047|nr:nuclear transport factor 2 family protein [Streptacidiphilus rugosus]